jgi:hypothetical protein
LKKAILAGLAASILILCGCSTVSVTTDYDLTASFANYRTYALEPLANAPSLWPTADEALRSALHENLAARGIREVRVNDMPDLAVIPQARFQQRCTRLEYNHWGYGVGGWPFGAGYYGMWIGEPYPGTTIGSDIEGTLILDFVETSNQALVFRGIGKGRVSSAKGEKLREAVEKIVAKLPKGAQSPLVARQ